MPFGEFVNVFPPVVFLAVHLAILVLAVVFGWRAFGAGAHSAGWGFALIALAELSYMTYHLDWTVFLFAHTISEVLVLLALVAFSVGAIRGAGGLGANQAGTVPPVGTR